jgi:hypothetical protein
MPEGVRLHHPELRNCVFTITNYAQRLVVPMFCAQCSGGPEGQSLRNVIHEFKTIHLNIDAVGDVVVAEGIYEMMLRNGLVGELRATKAIPRPEPMRVGMGAFERVTTVDRERGLLNGKLRS